MPVIQLPDGSEKQFDGPVTVSEVAQAIGRGLFKVAVAGQVQGDLVACDALLENDASLVVITLADAEALPLIRHACIHLLAQAAKRVFPTIQVAGGDITPDGFYCDFSFERPFQPDDLEAMGAAIRALIKEDLPLTRRVVTREEAMALFEQLGEGYQVKALSADASSHVTIFQCGEFVDRSTSVGVRSTGQLKAVKLTKIGGAYWLGDSQNEMLQRVYGTAWGSQAALKEHMAKVQAAEQRDHRLLAKKMGLFHIQPEAPGSVFWHPNGWQLILTIRGYLRDLVSRSGYQEINTPQLLDETLWERSGHKAKFNDDMFSSKSEHKHYIVKPMNCPAHVQVFKQGLKSYRDLPIRYAEFGHCHRNEPSGTLHGLMRLRAFVQDDGHIFCTESQIYDESHRFIEEVERLYRDFGFTKLRYALSTRPDKRVGDDAVWDLSETILERVLSEHGVAWSLQPGEGAFYGPKIEFALEDCLGRVWQCATLQVDFSMPERLGAHYIDEEGQKKPPVMLHRAILGSFERFVGVLLEHHGGKLPLWLSPVQVVVITITGKQVDFAKHVLENLQSAGFRVHPDFRNETMGFKIREHTIARVPCLVVIGDREVEQRVVSVRLSDPANPEGGSSNPPQSIEMAVDRLIQVLRDRVGRRM